MQEAEYWNDVASHWNITHPQALWRLHSDWVNQACFEAWLPTENVRCLLKTDAFDEAYGSGLSTLLQARAERVVGMDIATSVLRAARASQPGMQVVGADVRALPFADATFDVIVSNSTLDHFATLEEIVASLHELRRVLRDGGLLLLTLDNLANPVIALRSALPWRWLQRWGVVPYYVGVTCDPPGLQQMLEQTCFYIAASAAIMHCPRVLAVPVARWLGQYAPPWLQRGFLRLLQQWESLGSWPTRFRTGHFIAVKAIAKSPGAVSAGTDS